MTQRSLRTIKLTFHFSSKWKWPAVPGLSEFKGKLLHTANWDDSYDLTEKRVGVIGAGSSGVQLVAALQESE